jgi:ATP-dependent RNA helicase RhlE
MNSMDNTNEQPLTFEQFDLKPELVSAVTDLGFTQPTPIQAQTIPLLLQGHDIIGCAQTGTGKTAAFSLPVLHHLEGGSEFPQALIITPTRELAEQILQSVRDFTRHLPIRSTVVYGGVSARSQEAVLKQGVDVLIATPGRLLDHLGTRVVKLSQIKFLILDEADRMLDMGFIPDIENIMTYLPRKRQTLLFSATMPPAIEKLARNITKPDAQKIATSSPNTTAESVTQWICSVRTPDKLDLLARLLKTQDMSSVIVFCRTKIGADRLARELGRKHIAAAAIHSNLDQTQRQRALDGFKRGAYRILVATDIAARGIDIDNVSHVINYDVPTHPEDYVHRIGRTGRASATGEALTFCSPEEQRYLKNIEKLIGKTIPESPLTERRSEKVMPELPREKVSRIKGKRPEGSMAAPVAEKPAPRFPKKAMPTPTPFEAATLHVGKEPLSPLKDRSARRGKPKPELDVAPRVERPVPPVSMPGEDAPFRPVLPPIQPRSHYEDRDDERFPYVSSKAPPGYDEAFELPPAPEPPPQARGRYHRPQAPRIIELPPQRPIRGRQRPGPVRESLPPGMPYHPSMPPNRFAFQPDYMADMHQIEIIEDFE